MPPETMEEPTGDACVEKVLLGDTGQRLVCTFFQAELVEAEHLATIRNRQPPGHLKRRDALDPCRSSASPRRGSLNEGSALAG